MTLRITLIRPSPSALIKLDGRLTGEDVPELCRVCRQVMGPMSLDLTDLRSVDRQGAGALRELKAKGAEFTGLSPYVRLLVEPQDGV